MAFPICIHCGSDEIRVTQAVRILKSTEFSYEEDFYVNTNPCSGCTQESCCDKEEPGNRVYFEDDGDCRYTVRRYENEALDGTHPIHNYEVADDDLCELSTEYETQSVVFTTTCCGVQRDHVRELVRMDDGPATFDDDSQSYYSDNLREKPKPVTADELFSGGLSSSRSEMDDVLDSIADLP